MDRLQTELLGPLVPTTRRQEAERERRTAAALPPRSTPVAFGSLFVATGRLVVAGGRRLETIGRPQSTAPAPAADLCRCAP